MRIAISSNGKTLDDSVSDVFGRSPYFIIVQVDDKKINFVEAFENISKNQVGGTGVTVAQAVIEKEVNAVISGNIGPRALDVFKQFKIETFQAKGTVKQALQDYLENKLKKIQ
jgi:predicted Fe-Mo cluster-binding NifX family protein